ncbi:MAG: AAA family ATPase [Capsulimonadaceae bacterium]
MRINNLNIKGYRPFRNFWAGLASLEVIVGANGTGKSSLFEFLRFLRDSVYQEIPPEVISGAVGQQIFHIPGPQRFRWSLDINTTSSESVVYSGELTGPIGRTHITAERVESAMPLYDPIENFVFMDMAGRTGVILDPDEQGLRRQEVALSRSNQLALSTITNPRLTVLFGLREYIRAWRFYSAFSIDNNKIRKSVPIEQDPVLHEDAGNLSSVLHYLMTEHQAAFQELQQHLRSVVPGFRSLNVKARGGPGEVIAFWSDSGVDTDLSLADLSDGSLRLLCWITLCLLPSPPTLLCIDEPDQGVHPRTLPVLAGLFQKASARTQILLATHASYFLSQFELSEIAVIRKVDGSSEFAKPGASQVLLDMLADYGTKELEAMHRSDELEKLA